jgi:hypothetical protein
VLGNREEQKKCGLEKAKKGEERWGRGKSEKLKC